MLTHIFKNPNPEVRGFLIFSISNKFMTSKFAFIYEKCPPLSVKVQKRMLIPCIVSHVSHMCYSPFCPNQNIRSQPTTLSLYSSVDINLLRYKLIILNFINVLYGLG